MAYRINLATTAAAILAFSGLVQAKVCGSAGWSGSTDSYYYDDSGKQGSYSVCSQLCIKDSACQSFSIGSNTCELFNVAVAGNFDADSSSPYQFYDRSCVSTATSSSTTIKSSSTTGKTSSTTSSKTTSTTPTTSTTSSKTTSTTPTTSTTSSKTTSTSTTKSSSTTIVKSSSTSARASSTSGIVIPSGCSVPSQRTVTSFSWFNSTHNADCAASHPDVGDGTGCLNSTSSTTQWCDPSGGSPDCTHCGIGVCMTGLPPQPIGYGPPDDVEFAFSDGFSCGQTNPRGYKPFEVGEGHMDCISGSVQMAFTANSEAAHSNGIVSYNGLIYCDQNQSVWAFYNTSFPIDCVHDAGHNATCTTPGGAFNMPLVSVTVVNNS